MSNSTKLGADIGNGYRVGYRELQSLSRLEKAGVNTNTFFDEPLNNLYAAQQPANSTWTLSQQLNAINKRVHPRRNQPQIHLKKSNEFQQ